ncbi:MAG: PEP-CTERM sorting domain-containing protein, partial [Colwellia sp.]|nr:PEP-CTERM sorting domain-containing protein [Colwellia sp.]
FAQVFLDDVIVDGVEYDFDTLPELTNGCDRAGFCEIWVPYLDAGNGNVTSAWYVNRSANDYTGSIAWTGAYAYGDNRDYMTFTNFERMAAVPEPTTLAIFALGILGLASRRMKKQ